MSELNEKVKASIARLRTFEPKDGEGYYLAFSGGKDSVTIKALCDMAGVKYDAHYRVTSVDPPELVRFIMDKYPDCERAVPRWPQDFPDDRLAGKPITMWNLIPKKLMPPTRIVRYCCDKLKESGGDGRMTVTGVRWAESNSRKANQGPVTIMDRKAAKLFGDNEDFAPTRGGGVVLVNDNEDSRRMIEHCYKRHKTTVNPIIDWTDEEIWYFIRQENIPYCGLYDCGFKRLGCIGCPMARKHGREMEFKRWPKYKENYIRAFERMIEERIKKGRMDKTWRIGTTGEDIFRWWMEYDILPGQTSMFESKEEDDD